MHHYFLHFGTENLGGFIYRLYFLYAKNNFPLLSFDFGVKYDPDVFLTGFVRFSCVCITALMCIFIDVKNNQSVWICCSIFSWLPSVLLWDSFSPLKRVGEMWAALFNGVTLRNIIVIVNTIIDSFCILREEHFKEQTARSGRLDWAGQTIFLSLCQIICVLYMWYGCVCLSRLCHLCRPNACGMMRHVLACGVAFPWRVSLPWGHYGDGVSVQFGRDAQRDIETQKQRTAVQSLSPAQEQLVILGRDLEQDRLFST